MTSQARHYRQVFFILFALLMYNPSIFGQKECATDQVHQMLFEQHPELLESRERLEKDILDSDLSNARDLEIITIPVAVHVLHVGEPIGQGSNISDQQIMDAIEYANLTWRNSNGIGADMKVEFCLAQRDPQGNPSSGIVRVDASHVPKYASEGISHFGDVGGANELTMKNLSNWPHNFVYNIWVVNKIAGGWAGYAYYPIFIDIPLDGTVVWYPYIDSGAGTLAHELGHGMNLIHTFGNNGEVCDPNTNCNGQGDKVCDTAPHKIHECSFSTCSDNDSLLINSFRNYMSYCFYYERFTQGQVDRVRSSINTSVRRFLKNSNACQAPVSTGSTDAELFNEIIIYPNPTSGNFNIVLPINGFGAEGFDIQIYDELGKLNYAYNLVKLNENILEIQSSLTPGVYMVNISCESHPSVFKRFMVF